MKKSFLIFILLLSLLSFKVLSEENLDTVPEMEDEEEEVNQTINEEILESNKKIEMSKEESSSKEKKPRKLSKKRSSSSEHSNIGEMIKNSEHSKNISSFFDTVEELASQHLLPFYIKIRKHEYFPTVIITLVFLKVLSVLLSLCRSSNKKTLVVNSEASGDSKSITAMINDINTGISELKKALKEEAPANATEGVSNDAIDEIQNSISGLSQVMSNFQNSILDSQKEIIRDVVSIKKSMYSSARKSAKENKTNNSVISRKSSVSSIKENLNEKNDQSQKKEEPKIEDIEEEKVEKEPVRIKAEIKPPTQKVQIPPREIHKENPKPAIRHVPKEVVKESPVEIQENNTQHEKEPQNQNEIPRDVKKEAPKEPLQRENPARAMPKVPIGKLSAKRLANPPTAQAQNLFNDLPTEEEKKSTLETFQSRLNDPARQVMKSSAVYEGENKVPFILRKQIRTPFPLVKAPPKIPTTTVRRQFPQIAPTTNTGQQGVGMREGQQRPGV